MSRLFRSRKNAVLGGVCGGIGEALDVDPTIARLIWAIMFFAGGIGGLVYLLAWMIIPREPVC